MKSGPAAPNIGTAAPLQHRVEALHEALLNSELTMTELIGPLAYLTGFSACGAAPLAG